MKVGAIRRKLNFSVIKEMNTLALEVIRIYVSLLPMSQLLKKTQEGHWAVTVGGEGKAKLGWIWQRTY